MNLGSGKLKNPKKDVPLNDLSTVYSIQICNRISQTNIELLADSQASASRDSRSNTISC